MDEIQTTAVKGYDVKLLFPVLFLVGIGIVMVYSASSALAMKKYGTDYFFLKKQALFALLGIIALVGCRHFPYRWYRYLAYPLLLTAIVCLAALQVPGWGHTAGGATRWLRLGWITFQPSELARLALIIYLAYSMDKKKDQLKSFSIGFVPHVMVLAVLSALIFIQPDFGSVIILWSIAWIMLFVGGVRMRHLMTALVPVVPIAFFMMSGAQYRIRRFMSFLNPWEYPNDAGYQVIHSLMAFGSGGLWGQGLGKGFQKLFYLPEPHTDFIFSVIGEELGLAGVWVILALYVLLLGRGMRIARNAGDTFGSLMGMGLTTAIIFQVCVNIGVTLGLLPTKGLTLPFLSYGGTSLLINMASIGILMNISASQNLSEAHI